jgi:hypothetical protein
MSPKAPVSYGAGDGNPFSVQEQPIICLHCQEMGNHVKGTANTKSSVFSPVYSIDLELLWLNSVLMVAGLKMQPWMGSAAMALSSVRKEASSRHCHATYINLNVLG